ncbi:PoNe immunity protein domain-containing protein [Aquincola sp. MAHUQ-54]|uniref:PoNe immunity protein domain-containing protein n=1 Tax=Aquincola agrisoli TaxID=3119538 RepID=A0AAW9Q8S4_9BURK
MNSFSSELAGRLLCDVEGTLLFYKREFPGVENAEGAKNTRRTYVNLAGKRISIKYISGCPLDEMQALVKESLQEVSEIQQWIQRHVPRHPDDHVLVNRPLYGLDEALAWLLHVFCLLPDRADTVAVVRLWRPLPNDGNALIDHFCLVLDPEYRPLTPIDSKRPQHTRTFPVLAAIACPPAERAQALATHMNGRNKLMARCVGWKPNVTETYDAYPYMAYDVALAVCLYDIDDSSFRDHDSYPRDLVDHYRAHWRHTRDADRPIAMDSGLPPMELAVSPKADLSKSKRKGIARWVELVCDGDDSAADAVLEQIGKPRKVEDLWELTCALSEQTPPQAIHADVRDDETLVAQAGELCIARAELGGFEAPEGPPHGGIRCTAALRALDGWARARGYRLIDLDGQDDAWHAVLVREIYAAELLTLSQSLGLVARDSRQTYTD